MRQIPMAVALLRKLWLDYREGRLCWMTYTPPRHRIRQTAIFFLVGICNFTVMMTGIERTKQSVKRFSAAVDT